MEELRKREKVRRHIVEELVSNERLYIDKLNFLKKVCVGIVIACAVMRKSIGLTFL